MWTSRSGQTVSLSPQRAQAIVDFARRQGASRLLGVPLNKCDTCIIDAVTQRVARLARTAQAVGTWHGSRGTRYHVLESSTFGPPYRLLTRRNRDGLYELIWVHRAGAAGSSLGVLRELQQELEEEVSRPGLRVNLTWRRTANPTDVFANKDAVYIWVDSPRTKNPIKVGLTTNMAARSRAYPAGSVFYVGTLREPVTTKHPGQVLPTIEHAVVRALRRAVHPRAVLDPKRHKKPIHPFRTTGRIEIGGILPTELRQAFPVNLAHTAVYRGRGPRFDSLAVDRKLPSDTLAIPRGKLFEGPLLETQIT